MFLRRTLLVASLVVISACETHHADSSGPTSARPSAMSTAKATPSAAPSAVSRMTPASLRTARFVVQGLTCEGCAWQIRDLLKDSAGVIAIRTDVEGKGVDIDYDAERTSDAALESELRRIGYPGALRTTSGPPCQ